MKVNRRLLFGSAFLIVMFNSNIIGQDKNLWVFDANLGAPINIALPLRIEQDGYSDIEINARFRSRPFSPPPYWFIRLAVWKHKKAWEIELKHQKLYLKNKPPEVQFFSISHGHNQLTINRAFKKNLFNKHEFIYRFGLGIVIAHAENEVRNLKLDENQSLFDFGYYISGPIGTTAIAKQFKIFKDLYLNNEAKFTLTYGTVPIVNGRAYFWHSAVELGIGLSYQF